MLLVIRATLLLCLILFIAPQLTPMAVPRTADRPLTPDEQSLEVVYRKACWFEAVVFGWLITVVLLHTPLSHTIHTET